MSSQLSESSGASTLSKSGSVQSGKSLLVLIPDRIDVEEEALDTIEILLRRESLRPRVDAVDDPLLVEIGLVGRREDIGEGVDVSLGSDPIL